jgi:hypothetical protein
MKQYNNLGQDAVQGAFAEGASTNSGNIDSFAQANANRQQIAYTTAGIQAALQAANQNQANWQNVYNSMTSHLANMGALNNDVLGHATNIYATDSAERQNALNAVTGLAGQEMVNNMNWYNNLLGYDQAIDTTKLGITSDLYTNDVNNEHDSWKTQYTTEAAAAEAEKDRQNQITLQAMVNAAAAEEIKAQQDLAAAQWLAEQKIASNNPTQAPYADNAPSESDVFQFVNKAVLGMMDGSITDIRNSGDLLEATSEAFPSFDYNKIVDIINSVYGIWNKDFNDLKNKPAGITAVLN